MRCDLPDRHTVPRPSRPRRLVQEPTRLPSAQPDLGWSVSLAVSASRPVWVCTPAEQEVVDRFAPSVLAPVRPTIAPRHMPRCPRMSGRQLLPLRHWLCSIHMRKSERPCGTPCHTVHRSESWALPSLCRATPSATSEPFLGLIDSSPIPPSSSLLAFPFN